MNFEDGLKTEITTKKETFGIEMMFLFELDGGCSWHGVWETTEITDIFMLICLWTATPTISYLLSQSTLFLDIFRFYMSFNLLICLCLYVLDASGKGVHDIYFQSFLF